MILPFPKRIPLAYALVAGGMLAAILLAEANPPGICFIVYALVLVGTIGFNIAGGMHHPIGAYILFCTVFTGLLGAVVKAATNEPLLTNVPNADQTLLMYLLGLCGTVLAAMLSKRVAPAKPLLANKLTSGNTNQVVLGCVVLGIGMPIALFMVSQGLGSIGRQLNILLPMAVLIGVYQRTRATGGASSFSWPAFIAWFYSSWFGLLNYSKELMFAPTLAWIVAAAAARLRVTILQVLIAVPSIAFAVLVLVPFSQYGRNFRAETAADPSVAYRLLRHPLELRARVNAAQALEVELYHWYNTPRGIFDRLTVVPIDSALIRRTDATGTIGIRNLVIYFENIIPHFLLPNKPDIHSGNDYAHEIGMLAPEDHTTGISFSPFADAYHQAGWFGVLFIMPAVQFLLFFMLNLVVGSSDDAPWALFFIMSFSHIAAEGMLAFPVYVLSFGMEAIIATAYLMVYITPIIGGLLVGSKRVELLHPPLPRSHLRTATPRPR